MAVAGTAGVSLAWGRGCPALCRGQGAKGKGRQLIGVKALGCRS